MREVILTIGPMCAGKSTFCRKVMDLDPNLVLVSRDAILVEMYGTIWANSDEDHVRVWEELWSMMAELTKPRDTCIILDAWNGTTKGRLKLMGHLRGLKVERVVGWHFTTSLEQTLEWFLVREAERCRQRPIEILNLRWKYREFYEYPIRSDLGFDEIIRIDPLIDSPADFAPQTSLAV